MASLEAEDSKSVWEKAKHFAHIWRDYQNIMSMDLEFHNVWLPKAAGMLRESRHKNHTWIAYSAIPGPPRRIWRTEEYPHDSVIAKLLRRIRDDNPVTGHPPNPFPPSFWSEIIEQIEFLEIDEERDCARAALFESPDNKKVAVYPSPFPSMSAHATGAYETVPTATERQLHGQDYENFQELLHAMRTFLKHMESLAKWIGKIETLSRRVDKLDALVAAKYPDVEQFAAQS